MTFLVKSVEHVLSKGIVKYILLLLKLSHGRLGPFQHVRFISSIFLKRDRKYVSISILRYI